MRWLFARALRPLTLLAALASLLLNVTMLAPPLFMLLVFDRVFSSRSAETLVMLTALAALALALMYAMDATRAAVLATAGQVLDRRLGPPAVHTLIGDAARFGGARQVHLMRDAALLRSFVTGSGVFALFDAPWVPIYLMVIFAAHPLLGVAATAAALALFALVVVNERLTRAPTDAALAHARAASRFVDAAARNADAVVGMGMVDAVVDGWRQRNERVAAEQVRLARVAAWLGAFVRTSRHGMQVAMLALGAWLVIDERLTPGVMVAATILLARALQPVELLIAGWKSLVEARGAWARLRAVPDASAAGQRLALPAPRGRVDVERVVFGDVAQRPPVIKGVSFSLQPGETMGLIGPSAAGKTTLARLVLGIWRPLAGTVRLDGADIAQWDRRALGQHLGYLPQDVELFAGSVAENIARMGPVDAAAVVRAARAAGAHELILRLPDGYETQVGDGGSALSGGQRQRIGLARALYGEPALVVLDEPDANLDRDGEAALGAALAALKSRGCTVIVIGHRPSTLKWADKVGVLVDGVLEDFGRPEILARYAPKPAPVAMASPGAS